MRRVWLIYLGLFLVTMAVFWPVAGFGLINYDDPDFITENPHLKDGLSPAGIAWAFREPLVGNWHPITSLSLLLNWQMCGLNAGAFHLGNLLLHAVNVLLLFHGLRRMTQDIWPSALVAALFALHPVQVEAVAWVAERKTVLSTFWGLLAIGAYWRYTQAQDRKGKIRNYAFTVICFALGLMSKPILVTWPFVFLLLDFWPLRRLPEGVPFKKRKETCFRLILEKAPFFALSVAMCVVTVLTHQQAADIQGLDQMSMADRLSNALVSYARYIGKVVWPAHLALPYPYIYWTAWQTAAAAAVLGLATGAVIWQRRRRPFLLAGWLFFLGTLVPVIGILQEGGQAMADRHMYISCLGLFVMPVWAAMDIGKRTLGAQRAGAIAAGAALALAAGVTHRQLGYWRGSEALFQHAVDVTPANPLAEIKLGEALVDEGKIDEGLGHYYIVLKMYPTLPEVHAKVAAALDRQGKIAECISHYYAALRSKPDMPEVLNNLAWILASSRDPKVRNGPEAVRLAENACNVAQPLRTTYLGTLAAAYAAAGRFDDAIATAQRACSLAAASGDTVLWQRNQQLLALY